ncbi:hypothetical protein PQU92_12420 [Asticcacaulis sp. BYS171W]|uniref:Tetratricopeptide repeat protein n=1 Tax=Asticcacaulis aquaticus TaxID=2984212 RepID=A0ABT5HVH4_9CAUL|nr:hypothetical protein [Asticcacaulis aquaticus]MDC7684086.1 hypothetical protein [Asticcacaulis aquaticus]
MPETTGHSRANAGLFIGLSVIAAGLVALALIKGGAPLSAGLFLGDWIDWARIAPTMSGLLVLGALLFLVGVVGTLVSLMTPKSMKPTRKPRARVDRPAPAETPAPVTYSAPEPMAEPVAPPVPQLVADNTRKASLRFEAPAPASYVPPVPTPVVEPNEAVSAEIIPFRPEPVTDPVTEPAPEPVVEEVATEAVVEVTEAEAADPIAAALLAEAPDKAHPASPPADINAVINSAMRFMESPAPTVVTSVADVHAARVEAEEPVKSTAEYKALSEALDLDGREALLDSVVLEPKAPVSAPVTESDPQSDIAAAVQAALAAWPDSTRPIAEAELSVRIGQLYYDNAVTSRDAFARLKSGDLDGAAGIIKDQASEWAAAGLPGKAADMWRIFGALHMGRDDAHAMTAYEQVSALDPADGNIHMYLVHRYRMSEDTAKLLPVIGRALGVVTDRDQRLDLLTQYADLTQKAGHLGHTAQALEELSQIKGLQSAETPDNLQLRSAHAISLAKLAQVREMQGERTKAAPLYQHAHRVFAELSARVPDHAGLKAMAENARKDAERLTA